METRSGALVILMLSCLLCLASCGSTLNFTECTDDTSCAGFGEGLVCSPEKYCVLDVGRSPNNDANNDSVACEKHTECSGTIGDTWICGAEKICVNALNARCTKIAGPLGRDNVVILGSIFPTVEFSGSGLPREQAVELALTEFNDAGGLPGGRQLVIIGCDDSGNRDLGIESATHLVDTIGVPAIIGPAFSGVYIDVTTQVTVPGGVMTISPSATNPGIASLPDNGLVWRTAANDVFQSVAIADFVRDEGATSIVAFGKDDPYGKGLLERVTQELASELGEEGFFSALYNDPGGDEPPDYSTLVLDALQNDRSPQMVLILGTSEAAEIISIFEQVIEDRGLVPPLYVLSDGGKNINTLTPLLENNPVLLEQITGTEPFHFNGDLYEAFALRFKQKFRADPGTFTANTYDATYLLAYAISSLDPEKPLTGADIAGAMSLLVEGRKIDAGPGSIPEARDLLRTGNSIDYVGASGKLDFDLDVGEAPANVARWTPEIRNDELRFNISALYIIGDQGGQWGDP